MSDSTEAYHKAAQTVEATNRFLRQAAVIAISGLLVVALVVIGWGSITFQHQQRQLSCQTAALNSIMTELANSQRARVHGQPSPPFVYPKPC